MCWWEVFTLETWLRAWLTGHPAPCLISSQACCWALAFFIPHPGLSRERRWNYRRPSSFQYSLWKRDLKRGCHSREYLSISKGHFNYLQPQREATREPHTPVYTTPYTHRFTHTLYTHPLHTLLYTHHLTFDFGMYFWLAFEQEDKQNWKSPNFRFYDINF